MWKPIVKKQRPRLLKGSRLHCQRGFSLIELLIVIALIGVVSIPLSAALIMGLKMYQSESTVVGIEQQQRAAISRIESQVRKMPDLVTIDPDGKILTVDQTVYQVDADGVLNEVKSGTSNPLCANVTEFTLRDIKRSSGGKLEFFAITLTTVTTQQTYTLKTSIALDRY